MNRMARTALMATLYLNFASESVRDVFVNVLCKVL